MKKLLKNIQFLTFITFIFASMLSCSNLMGKKSANESVAAKKDAAYITLNVADIGRNVNPVIEVDALTNLELKGTKTGAIEQTLGKWDAVSNLQSARLAVSTGEWSFTLTAKAGGVNGTRLSGTISKQIELGDNALNFVLSISDDGAGEENRVGSFEITLNYANAENADKVSYVTASLENMAGISVTGFAQPVQLTPASNSVSFAANDIPAGTYRARVKFYAASNQTGVADFEIASYRELVQISSGLTSSATRKIESFDNLYTITYHLNGGSLSAGTTLQESFTRKSTITLPTSTTISRDYYNFGGWYTDSNFTTGNEISTVSNITTNLDVYAKFTIKDYSISFISNGGTILESIPSSYTYVSDTILLPEPQRNNYVFRGWFLEEDFSGERQRELATGSYGEKTYYAKWLEHSGPDDGFVLVKGGFIEGRDNESQYKGVFPEGRRVELSNFYICDHEVTQAEYEKYCWYTQEIPGRSQNANFGLGADYPVYFVSAYDAVVYCNLKSMAEGLTPCYRLYAETDPKRWNEIKVENGKLSCNYTESNNNTYWNNDLQCDMKASGYRLPTEAEWEYAARGGYRSLGYKFSGSNILEEVAWYDGNSAGMVHPVKLKKANELGLYDMSGNVWEWCQDWYETYSSEYQKDPKGPSKGTYHVDRGGAWNRNNKYSRVTARCYDDPGLRNKNLGFRLVMVP